MKKQMKVRTVTLRKTVDKGVEKLRIAENRSYSNMVDTILSQELERRALKEE